MSTVIFTLAANVHDAKLKKQIVPSVSCILVFEALRKVWHWNTNDRKGTSGKSTRDGPIQRVSYTKLFVSVYMHNLYEKPTILGQHALLPLIHILYLRENCDFWTDTYFLECIKLYMISTSSVHYFVQECCSVLPGIWFSLYTGLHLICQSRVFFILFYLYL